MAISSVQLIDFRNFKKKKIEFSDKTTVIIGPNASGKTNILEALYLLSTGKSFRAHLEEEMIDYKSSIASITGLPAQAGITHREEKLTRGDGDWPRKRMLVNGVPKRLIDFAGLFKTVLFGPWDMDLVTESPTLRRRFLDNVLSQVDREYRRATLSYEKGLRQRNRLLYRIREEGVSRNQLLFWNQLLIRAGDYISQQRGKFIEFINAGNFQFPNSEFQLEYDKSSISETRLEQYAEEEVAAATTLVGPHRDDFVFEIRNAKNVIRNLASYGSRGEQRMAVLWLKLAELAFIEAKTGDLAAQAGKPTLLLDDIFSELDHEHRDVVKKIVGKQQTIITTADEHFVRGFGKASIIELI